MQNDELLIHQRPLDVLRVAIDDLHSESQVGQLEQLFVRQGRLLALFRWKRCFPDATFFLVDEHDLLVGDLPLDNFLLISIDHKRVRRDPAGHDGFPQPPGGFDHHLLFTSGERVQGEQHTGDLGLDLLLHHHAHATGEVV